MLLYADEDFFYPVVVELRRLGHDVVTAISAHLPAPLPHPCGECHNGVAS